MVVYFTVLGSPEHRYYSALRSIQPAPTTFSSNAVSTTAISSAVYYYGIFDVDNRDGRLKTTMTANVSIVLAQALHVLSIPSSALGSRAVNGSYQVRVVGEDKKISNRAVMVGINDGARAQLLSGLKEGEKVVLGQIESLTATSTSSSTGARRSGAPRGASL
jgi:macrolide-specific efflux system membrane fusion protein